MGPGFFYYHRGPDGPQIRRALLLLAISGLLAFALYAGAQMRPLLGSLATTRVSNAVNRIVYQAVNEAIERWRASGRRTLGVIAKSDFLAARYAELIARDHDLTLLTDETDAYPGGIVVSSVRLAKGLEFDEAVLLDADGRRYATEADRNLLYVAVTRAMHALTVLYRDEPSPFLGEKRPR